MRTITLFIVLVLAPCGGMARVYPAAKVGDPVKGKHAFFQGDLGSGKYGSLPVAVFKAMPHLFADKLPKDLALIGLYPKAAELDDGLPAGFVVSQQMGIPFAASNCGVCHLGRLPGTTELYAGASNADFDVQRTARDLADMILDDRLNANAVFAAAADRGEPLGFYERSIVRLWLWRAKAKLKEKPLFNPGTTGPGRSDAVNSWKRVLNQPIGDALSYVDTPVIYNQRLKTRTLYDGAIVGDPAARVMLTEVQKGRKPYDLLSKREVFDDLIAFLEDGLPPPKFPYAIDRTLAARGAEIFDDQCARCHGHYGTDRDYPNKRVPLEKIGTDPSRAHAMDAALEKAIGTSDFAAFLQMERELSYMPPPLDGIWASAPYLHNGSVPSLAALFAPEEERPQRFYRRMNAYDPKTAGLACAERVIAGIKVCEPDERQLAADPERRWLFLYDTKKPGNSNAGHTFTSDLEAADKPAVLEYLKTL